MRLISGMLKHTRGAVLLDGIPIQGLEASRIAHLGLAHAPEGTKADQESDGRLVEACLG